MDEPGKISLGPLNPECAMLLYDGAFLSVTCTALASRSAGGTTAAIWSKASRAAVRTAEDVSPSPATHMHALKDGKRMS